MYNQDELKARLSALQSDFINGLPERIADIEKAWKALSGKPFNKQDTFDLMRKVHSLSGAGATFGMQKVTDCSRVAEGYLQMVLETEHDPDQFTWDAALSRFLSEMQEALHATSPVTSAASVPVSSPEQFEHTKKNLFLIMHHSNTTLHLKEHLVSFGYHVHLFPSLDDASKELNTLEPAALVLSLPFDGKTFVESERIALMRNRIKHPVIFLLVTDETDLNARLSAVRAGFDGYMVHPVQPNDIADKLESLLENLHETTYKVLLVEDEQKLAEFYKEVLLSAGFQVAVQHNPAKVLDTLTEFAPDLVLMDMYLPICSGIELAKVMRHMQEYITIPIVYLSSEANIEKQLNAMSIGGDDFLTKPIQPEHLIAAVRNRLKRSRMLRSLMVKDSLTGLLNHTNLIESLNTEVERARRTDSSVAFAMLDLDHFKKVNDTYGHPVGDKVLRTLSNLLKQMLRKTDSLGRYGGEEFAVVLPGASKKEAFAIVDKIRAVFSQIKHTGDHAEFQVTLSCGVATYPECPDPTSMTDRADKALYQAKAAGRNKVIVDGDM